MKNHRLAIRRESGFTMVEIMVAMVIGLILTAGTIQIFSSSRAAYQTTDALARVQEDGRYALQFLSRDIRGAGFTGCSNDVEITNVVTGTGAPTFTGDLIVGAEGGAGPDSVTIRMAENANLGITASMPSTSANMFLNDTSGLAQGDVLMVTDCGTSDVFTVTNVNQGGGTNVVHNSGAVTGVPYQNSTANFSKAYDENARVYKAVEKSYSIVNNGLQRTENGTAQTLVDNVQDLQIVYGLDADNDRNADTYMDASNIGPGNTFAWEDVVAARVSVTVVSALTNVAADGGNIQHTFSRTISLRNRLE